MVVKTISANQYLFKKLHLNVSDGQVSSELEAFRLNLHAFYFEIHSVSKALFSLGRRCYIMDLNPVQSCGGGCFIYKWIC